MRILLAHNFYQHRGGEDAVFFAEAGLLEAHGQNPLRYVLHNNQIHQMTYPSVAGKAIWNRQVHRELADLVRGQSIDVVHFHNTFPLISPAAYSAVRRQGAAVVQTLHNYRPLCPSATLFRDGHDCQDCLHRTFKSPAIVHRCYRHSFAASAVLTASLAYHHWRGTFDRDVDLFIAPSQRTKQTFIDGGFRADQIVVKPHFVDPDPGPGPGGSFAVFIGRLSQEKGVETLLEAWKELGGRVPLKVLGDGPLRDRLLEATNDDHSIEWLGRRTKHEISRILSHAAMLIAPFHTRETFGRSVMEAFACGTPVIAAEHGALADIVTPRTGMLFASRDAAQLAGCVTTLLGSPHQLRMIMRANCRHEFESFYTADKNYQQLIDIYQRAIRLAQARRAADMGSELAEKQDVPLPHNPLG